jgi:hypothetical protein
MPTLPLEQMTVKEKLQVMEELWSDLCILFKFHGGTDFCPKRAFSFFD